MFRRSPDIFTAIFFSTQNSWKIQVHCHMKGPRELNPNKLQGKRLLLWKSSMASYIITITVMSAPQTTSPTFSRLVESSSKKEGGYPRAFHQRFGPLMTSFPGESWDS